MRKGEKLLFLAGILLAIGALAFSAWKLSCLLYTSDAADD